MTLLGKIFTVMILLMTILFMGFSIVVFATHRNWKMIVLNEDATEQNPLGYRLQLLQAKENHDALEKEIKRLNEKLAVEQVARVSVLAALESRLTQEKSNYEQLAKTFETTKFELNRVNTISERVSDINTQLLAQVAGLRDNVTQVIDDRDHQFYEVVSLTASVNQLSGSEKRLTERRNQLVDQLAVRERLIRQNGISLEEDDQLPADLRGRITAVSDKRLVEVSIGSDDGVKVGHELHVFRNKTYLGRVVIRKTKADRSVGEILVKMQKGTIKVDDYVAAKLSS
ncbi:MAG: hypothetical protein ACI9G1_004399 [Pirellulaceae bacterium]|jgi:hypothetical protein